MYRAGRRKLASVWFGGGNCAAMERSDMAAWAVFCGSVRRAESKRDFIKAKHYSVTILSYPTSPHNTYIKSLLLIFTANGRPQTGSHGRRIPHPGHRGVSKTERDSPLFPRLRRGGANNSSQRTLPGYGSSLQRDFSSAILAYIVPLGSSQDIFRKKLVA